LLNKAEERKHIVEGLRIAVGKIDEVIRIIRAASDTDEAKAALMAAFGLSKIQSQAIVDMRLGRLTGLEREKLESEFDALLIEIADYEHILAHKERVDRIINEDLDDILAKYGDERRTEISREEVVGSFNIEELITEEMMVVTFSREGYVKRVPLDVYRSQSRGGRGIKGSDAKEGDVLRSLFVASTHDYVLFFSDNGKVYWKKVYELPEAGRTSKGRSIRNLLPVENDESVNDVLRVANFDGERSVVFSTAAGTIKKTSLEAYSRPRTAGIIAIKLADDDKVVSVALSSPGDTIVIATAKGRAARFDEKAVRNMGRNAGGVRGIRLKPGDSVVGMVVTATENATIVTACVNGYGKRTPIADYPIKGRGNMGVINIKVTERNGDVVTIARCHDGDDIMFITRSGMIVRSPAIDLRPMGRNTQGVRLVNIKSDDAIVAAEIVHADDQSEADLEGQDEGLESGESQVSDVPMTEAEPAEGADEDAADEDRGDES
jgi:DNA gyrase subunit A